MSKMDETEKLSMNTIKKEFYLLAILLLLVGGKEEVK